MEREQGLFKVFDRTLSEFSDAIPFMTFKYHLS